MMNVANAWVSMFPIHVHVVVQDRMSRTPTTINNNCYWRPTCSSKLHGNVRIHVHHDFPMHLRYYYNFYMHNYGGGYMG